ncbi:MAG: tetratricopeptide repeat protein [Chloroflexota bacterium]
MRALLSRILILLAVTGLIFTPPALTGYVELKNADLAQAEGDFFSAASSYARAARFLPWRADLWEKAAAASFLADRPEPALALYETARQRGSLSAGGWELYGLAHWQDGNLQAAQEIWLGGLQAYPSHAAFYRRLGAVYFEQGDWPAERDALEHWIALGGGPDAAAHYRLALLSSVDEPDRALGEFLLAASLDEQYDSAVETMRTALNLAALETDESKKLVVIGRGLGLVNEWALAEDAFRQAVDADGENAEAWAWLGEAGQQLGRDGRAALDQALSLGSANPIVHSLRGLYWMRQGQPEQALAEYQGAAERDPGNPLWQVSMAEAYAGLGDLPPALEAYLRAVEMAPGDENYWRLLAVFCVRYGVQVDETGLPAARQAATLAPDDPQALDALGWTLLSLGRVDEARYHLARALALAPDFALAHLHLGMAALQSGDRTAAYQRLLRARDLDPGGAVGEQAQALLEQYFP